MKFKSRIEKELKLDIKNLPIGTFHALANRALKKLANTININVPKDVLSEKERRDIINNLKNENPKILEELKYSDQIPSNVLKYIDQVREQLLDPEDAAIEASEKGDI